jgi:hypothetical protein
MKHHSDGLDFLIGAEERDGRVVEVRWKAPVASESERSLKKASYRGSAFDHRDMEKIRRNESIDDSHYREAFQTTEGHCARLGADAGLLHG